MRRATFALSATTQGPAYPPSEIMDENGDFVVAGWIPERGPGGALVRRWRQAVVAKDTEVPPFGEVLPYKIVRDLDRLGAGEDLTLCTLPTPLVGSNYPMTFAPAQRRAAAETRPSRPLHDAYIPDARPEDGRKVTAPIGFRQWMRAEGTVTVEIAADARSAAFDLAMSGLIPDSLYTVMALREHDLRPGNPTRPGPLGIPNAFIAGADGGGRYRAVMPNPFPTDGAGRNRIVNVIVLWMSTQMSYGGAIGYYGLGGDIHAQLKLRRDEFAAFATRAP